jgi:threonine aldolase
VAKNETPKQYGEIFDSISICLSKGLGTPVGSLLLGKQDFIKKARRVRKVFGGGMRQAGFLAAAGIYALQNNVDRLADDHFAAKEIAKALIEKEFIGKIIPIETNIIIFEVVNSYTPKELVERLKQDGILCLAISPAQVRMVTHLDVTKEMLKKLLAVIGAL